MAKKPEPLQQQPKRQVQYRALKKTFIGGTLHVPGEIFLAEEGLEGDAFEAVPVRSVPSVDPIGAGESGDGEKG